MASKPIPKFPRTPPIRTLEDARRAFEELQAYINNEIVPRLNAPNE